MLDFNYWLDRKYDSRDAYAQGRGGGGDIARLMAQRMKRGQDPNTGIGLNYREFAGMPTAGAVPIWGRDAIEQNEVQLRGGQSKLADDRYNRLAAAFAGMPGQPGANNAPVGLSGFLSGFAPRRVATGMPTMSGTSGMLGTTSFTPTETPAPFATASVKPRALNDDFWSGGMP